MRYIDPTSSKENKPLWVVKIIVAQIKRFLFKVTRFQEEIYIFQKKTMPGPPECMGTWGLVPTIFLDLVYHFQN